MRVARSVGSSLLMLATAVTFAGACGKLKPADWDGGAAGSSGAAGTGADANGMMVTGTGGSTGHTFVTISGTAAPHPLNHALGADEDFSMLRVAIIDPAAVILDPNATPLGSKTLDTSTMNCDATLGCAWSLPGVDITNQNLGLVGELEDMRTGDARVWVKTGTGMGTKADLDAVRANPAPITSRRAFAVSRKLEAKLGAFAGTVLGMTFAPGALEARGFLIGHVVAAVTDPTKTPDGVAGAKVAATGNFDIIYPSADFSSAGTTTSSTGIFLMVPKKAEPVVTMWDVVPPSGDKRTWEMHLAGSNPGNAFVIILPANP